MKQSTLLMFSFSVLTLGQLFLTDSANAGPDFAGTNADTNSRVINSTNSGGDLNGTFDSGTETFDFSNATGGFGVSPNIINLIPSSGGTGSFRRNTPDGEGGSTSLGGNDDPLQTEDSSEIQTEDSSEITICATDPCIPENGVGKAITLNDLAKLIEDDLNQAFNDLMAAEQLEQELIDRPRRIIKRRSANSCDCVPCVSPVKEARREFITKLENSREFVKEMERLKPENSIW